MADLLSSAALAGNADAAAKWKGCLGNLKRFVTEQLTGPFIQHLQVPGQAKPGLTFEVRAEGFRLGLCGLRFVAACAGLLIGHTAGPIVVVVRGEWCAYCCACMSCKRQAGIPHAATHTQHIRLGKKLADRVVTPGTERCSEQG